VDLGGRASGPAIEAITRSSAKAGMGPILSPAADSATDSSKSRQAALQEWWGRVRVQPAANGGSELLIFIPQAAPDQITLDDLGYAVNE